MTILYFTSDFYRTQSLEFRMFTYFCRNAKMISIEIVLCIGGRRMKRKFNITGSCSPQRHYMVRLDSRLEKIKENFID